MTEDDDIHDLADLNVSAVRAGNEHVDDRMSELESKISDLEQQVASLEDEKEEIEQEREAAEKLLADFRDSRREEQLDRIRQANEAVGADEEVDLSTLEDASVDQLETVAEMLESASTSEEVSNSDRTPDLSNLDGGSSDGGIEETKAQVAAENGLGRLYERAKNDDFDIDHTEAGSVTGGNGTQELLDAIEATHGDS